MTNCPMSSRNERTVRPTGSLAGSSPIISLVGSRLPIGGRIGSDPSAVMYACEQKSRPVHERGRSMAWCPDRACRSGHQTRKRRPRSLCCQSQGAVYAKGSASIRAAEKSVKLSGVDRAAQNSVSGKRRAVSEPLTAYRLPTRSSLTTLPFEAVRPPDRRQSGTVPDSAARRREPRPIGGAWPEG